MKQQRNIEFGIDEKRVPATLFKSKVNTFLDLLDEVSLKVSKGKKSVTWEIAVEAGSQILRAYPLTIKDTHDADTICNTIGEGIETISMGKPRPELLTDKALEDIMKLSQPYRKRDRIVDKFYIKTNGKQQKLNMQIVKYIEDIIGTATQAYGSVEGKLEVASKRHGYSFVITDVITDRAVKCVFKNEELFSKIFESWGKQVSVYGIMKYNKFGDIVSITVDDFRVLLDKNKLPGFADVLGIFKTN